MNRRVSSKDIDAGGAPNAPRVIAVTSGKGGVGKTNMVGNLALAFSKLGKKVMVFDADLGLANIDILFGLNPQYNLGHVINGEKRLKDIMVEGPENIRIVPAGSGLAHLTQLTEGQKLHLLSEFEAMDELLDIFLIDTGAGISDNVLYFNLAADECIVVATDEPTSITDAYAVIKVMATRYGSKYFKLIVNMVRSEAVAKSVYMSLSQAVDRFLNGVFVEYMGYMPYDEPLRTAVAHQKPVMVFSPTSASSKQFMLLAEKLMEAPRRHDSDGNIKFFLKRFIDYRSAENAKGIAKEA